MRIGTLKTIVKHMTDFDKGVLVDNLIYELYTFWKDDTAEIIVSEIEKLYICYLTKKDIEQFKDRIPADIYEFLSIYENGIIGAYILLTKQSVNNIRYIRYCQSILTGLNLMGQLIDTLEKKTKRTLLPRDAIPSAIPYWEIFFQKKYGVFTKEQLEYFIRNIGATIDLEDYFK